MASQVIEREAYQGAYRLLHNPLAKGSQPRYTVTNTTTGAVSTPRGVTTILGDTLSKDFVGWALNCMESSLIDQMSGFVTIDATAEEALNFVAQAIPKAKEESLRRKQQGADTGSLVHAMIETFLKTGEFALDASLPDEAKNAFGAFIRWFYDVKPEVIASEQLVYNPGDNEYAGCYDALLEIKGKTYLTDFKTTNTSRQAPKGVYPEYFLQLGAYAYALRRENNFVGPSVDGLLVVSVRKDGQLDTVSSKDLRVNIAELESSFLSVLELSNFLRVVKRKLGVLS